jgi:hypothetical protein
MHSVENAGMGIICADAARVIPDSPLADEVIEVQVPASMASSLRISDTTSLIGRRGTLRFEKGSNKIRAHQGLRSPRRRIPSITTD